LNIKTVVGTCQSVHEY